MAEITKFKTRGTQSLNVSQALDTSGISSARSRNIQQSGDLISNLAEGFTGLIEDNQKSLYQENYSTFANTVQEKQTALNIALETADVSKQKELVSAFNSEVTTLQNDLVNHKEGGALYKKLISPKLESLVTTAQNTVQLTAFKTVKKNTNTRIDSAQTQRAQNYGTSMQDVATNKGAMSELGSYNKTIGPEGVKKKRVAETTNFQNGVTLKALSSVDPEDQEAAIKKLEAYRKESFVDENGKTQKMADFIDPDAFDRNILRLKQAKSASGATSKAIINRQYKELKDGLINGYDSEKIQSGFEAIKPQLEAIKRPDLIREMEVLTEVVPKFRMAIRGASKEEKDNIINSVINTGEMVIDGERVQLDLRTFNDLKNSKSLLEDISAQDEYLKNSDPYKYVNEGNPNLTIEQNMALQKKLGVDKALPFTKEIYDNYIGSARRLGVTIVANELRKEHPLYLEQIAERIASDKNAEDVAGLALAMYAPPEAAEGILYYYDKENVNAIKEGFTKVGVTRKDLKDSIDENEKVANFKKEFNSLEKRAMSNKMSELVELTAMRAISDDSSISAEDAVEDAAEYWIDALFVKFDNNMETGSGMVFGDASTTIPRAYIDSNTKQGQVESLIDSIDAHTLTKWGFSADVSMSIVERGIVYYEGGKIKIKYDDNSYPTLKDGTTFEIPLDDINDKESNPIYEEFRNNYEDKNGMQLGRNSARTLRKIESERKRNEARRNADVEVEQ